MDRPFDDVFIAAMIRVATALSTGIQNSVLAYGQSDEISLLLHPYKRLVSQPWFGSEVQKMVSVSAGIASAEMTAIYHPRIAVFDSRAFCLPEAEVANYFVWRQKDAERNSLTMLAQSHYSHNQLMNVNREGQHNLLHDKGVNWNDLPTLKKRGFTIRRTGTEFVYDSDVPIFTQNRDYIEDLLKQEEE